MYILCRAETACGAKDSHRGEWGSRHRSRAETLQRRPRLRPGQSSPRWPRPLWWHLYFLGKQRHHVRTLISIYTLLHNLYVVHPATSDWSRLSPLSVLIVHPLYHDKVFFWCLGIPPSPEDYLDSRSAMPRDLEKPDCAQVLDLPYSIHAFQHLRVSAGQTWENWSERNNSHSWQYFPYKLL